MYAFNPVKDLLNVMYAPTCVACGETLVGDESLLCIECISHIPFTNFATTPGNQLELLLENTIPHVKAASLMYFEKGEVSQSIIHSIKYHGDLKLAHRFGRLLGKALADSHRFDDVDIIVPVPLHFLKWYKRGFNQSREISEGIAKIFKRPVKNRVIARTRYTETQTHKSHSERTHNVVDAFKVRNSERIKSKHILLVDDVITTGSTIRACYAALSQVEGIRISVASLAFAG